MPLPAGSMVRRFDLFGIILGLAGLTVIAVTPLEQRGLLLTGMFVTFLGAVLYGGVPSRNAIESVLTKIQFPMLIMAAVTALLVIRLLGWQAFKSSLLTWSFGFFAIAAVFAPLIQRMLGVGGGGA